MKEHVDIFIDATEFSAVVVCGSCHFRQVHDTRSEASKAGKQHRMDQHKPGTTATIHLDKE